MRWETRVLAVGVTSLAMIAGLAVPGAAQSSGEAPKATEIGVTAKEIHIAVVADVDTPLSPGLFKGGVDGVKAAAAYLNSKAGGGGVAGRRLVVDFYDSKLNATESRNATIQACGNDLAMVGTEALFLTQVEDMVGCKDEAGGAVGLPDLGAVVTSTQQRCAPISFPITGTAVDCATLDDPEQTYYGNQGEAKWLLSQHKNDLHGPIVIGNDVKNDVPLAQAKTLQLAGITPEQGSTVGVSARDPQSAYTAIIQHMKSDGSNYAMMASAVNSTLQMRNEATLQGLDNSKVVWDTSSAYGNDVVTQNADAFEGQYQQLGFLPFEEAHSNRTLTAFLQSVKKVGGKPDQFSVYSWAATLAFAQAARHVAAQNGVNGITRESLLTGIRSLNDFNGGGMVGTKSFKSGRGTHCFVEVRFTNGKWVRQYPSKKGTFDCKPANAVEFKAKFTQ